MTVSIRSLKTFSLFTAGVFLSSICFGQIPGLPGLPALPGLPGLPAGAGAAISIIAYVIEKHEASERQRRIAEERARRAYAKMPAKRKAALKAKKVRYIAVDTEKNEKTSPKAQKSVMVWDTQSEKMANESVYDVQKAPPVGATAKIDTYSAEYVGSGA